MPTQVTNMTMQKPVVRALWTSTHRSLHPFLRLVRLVEEGRPALPV